MVPTYLNFIGMDHPPIQHTVCYTPYFASSLYIAQRNLIVSVAFGYGFLCKAGIGLAPSPGSWAVIAQGIGGIT